MPSEQNPSHHYDAIVIGAGVSGLYALYHLREMGLSVHAYDGASHVGGTWWYNGYPGARVDGPGSPYYCYTFSDEMMQEWDWEETQPTRAAVLEYVDHFADRYDLRRDIELETWVRDARYDEDAQRWTVETHTGARASAAFLICAVGALSATHKPDIPGIEEFAGECHHTGNWPQEPVSFAGKRVGVIGTGSSGVQSIPVIAREAEHLTVFQRTPQYAWPARNRPLTAEEQSYARENWDELRKFFLVNSGGVPYQITMRSAAGDRPEQRQEFLERLWEQGTINFLAGNYIDIMTNAESNGLVADFVRGKIREVVHDPEIADKLMPDYYIGTKRAILEEGYFETYNRDNVTLVDLREDPIERFSASGAHTANGEHPLDMLVLATGFDAVTGAMLRLDPRGRRGVSLKEKWSDRFHNYLGLMISGFPNLFMIHGPGSPGVLYNMPLGAEREMAWIGDCIRHLREGGRGAIEPTPAAEEIWDEEVTDLANATLFPHTDSWWMGANIPGKPRQFCSHLGGPNYFQRIGEVAEKDYEGFAFEKERAAPTRVRTST